MRLIFLAMRMTVILLLAGCLTANAKGTAQTVSLQGKQLPLAELFNRIKQQTGYVFIYSDHDMAQAKPVTISLKNAPVPAALDSALKGQPLAYEIQGKTVFISYKELPAKQAPPPVPQAALPPPNEIHGRVVDTTGAPLDGASVIIKGTKHGTQTDVQGRFSLTYTESDITLVVSFTGYETKFVSPAGEGNLVIQLRQSNSILDQVQVQAYGTTSPRLSTGDITTITSKDIEKQPVSNPILALQGRVPGMLITQNSGISGAGVSLQIRGQNYFKIGGNDPLIVVDGVPYPSQMPAMLNSIFNVSSSDGSAVGSPLAFLDPNDIESISVLKDADATSIYGTRAANGAVLITTKKAKPGQTKVNFRIQDGFGQVNHFMPLMNSQQYLQMRREALKNDGISAPGPYDWDLQGLYDSTRSADWQKTLIGNTAHYNDYSANISGSSANTQYYLGTTYHRESTVFPNDFQDQRADVHFNLSSNAINDKLHIQFSGSYSYDDNQLPWFDLTADALHLAPFAPELYTPDGQINWGPTDAMGNHIFQNNPLARFLDKYERKTKTLVSSLNVGYQILPGLNISSSFGYNDLQYDESQIFPLSANSPEIAALPYIMRRAQFGSSDVHSWIIEPQLNYRKRISKGTLEALVGGTFNQSFSDGQQIFASGQNSDQLLLDLSAATQVTGTTTANAVYKYSAAFVRLHYNWQDKYIINLSARRDGSSRFGSANQLHNFASVGAAWLFAKEDAEFKRILGLSYGKLKASYGSTGSDQIGDYQYQNLYFANYYAMPYQGIASISPVGLTNPYLEWQSTRKAEVGLDLGFFKDRVLISADYFRNRSSNQLLFFPLPVITGFNYITSNLPAVVQNAGWEMTLNTRNINHKDFTWSTSFNISIVRNKLVSYPDNLPNKSYFPTGQPVFGKVFVYQYLGVDPATGVYEFSDGKGGKTSTPDDDPQTTQTKIVDLNPKFYGGLENSFTYKKFSLSFLFQFIKKKGLNPDFGNGLPGYSSVYGNQPAWLMDRWQQPGDNAKYQRFNSNYSIYQQYSDVIQSDAAYTDASYIRLKNLSLSWQLPQIWINKAGIKNAQLFVLGQNLLTITGYKGLDPETTSVTSLPPLKVISFGVQVTF